jgi:hypothetical protein
VAYELHEVPGGTRLRVVERLLTPTASAAWGPRLRALAGHVALCRV